MIMKRQTLIRIFVFVFLFSIGFLVGAGLSKTVRYLSAKTEVGKQIGAFKTQGEKAAMKPNIISTCL